MSPSKDAKNSSQPGREASEEPAQQADDSAGSPQADSSPSEDEGTEGTEGTDERTLKRDYLKLEEELRDEREKLLRSRAEMENLRKRTEREISAVRQYALESFATPLLEVRDNLERSVDNKNRQSLEDMRTGVEMTLKILSDVLARFNIEEIAPKAGEGFDPQWHEAMSTLQTSEHPPKAVIDLVQKGYRLHQRLLRPALVVVSKAPAPGKLPTTQQRQHDGSSKR